MTFACTIKSRCELLFFFRVPALAALLLTAWSNADAQIALQPVSKNDTIYVTGTGGGILRFTSDSSEVFSPENGHSDMVFDAEGNIFTIRFDDIMRVNPDGSTQVYATGVRNNSYGMAIDGNGSIFIANSSDNSIQVFDSSGAGTVFSNSSLLSSPFDVLFDGFGNLLVSNNNGTIVRLDREGNASVFASGVGLAMGMELDNQGNLFVVSNDRNKVYRIGSNGYPQAIANTMNHPWDLAFDSSGSMYVSSYWSGSVLKYTDNGQSSIFATYPQTYQAFFITINSVPEPTTASMVVFAAGCIGICRRNKRAPH